MEDVLIVSDLCVRTNNTLILDNVNLSVAENQIYGLIGVSGSGKSMTTKAILGLFNHIKQISATGNVNFKSKKYGLVDLSGLPDNELKWILQKEISVVFQDPKNSLNPLHKISTFLGENESVSKEEIEALMKKVGFTDFQRMYNSYPNELSGGQLQRIHIVKALIKNPTLVICDEFTSALDTVNQKLVLETLISIQNEMGFACLIISHDMRLIKQIVDKIYFISDGKILANGNYLELENNNNHVIKSYFNGLTRLEKWENGQQEIPKELVHIEASEIGLVYKSGFLRKRKTYALNNINFRLHKGENLGVVGMSGSGKSTLAKLVVRLMKPSNGTMLDHCSSNNVQLIFQNARRSFDPLMFIRKSLEIISSKYHKDELKKYLEIASLDESYLDRKPDQLSGGELQRFAVVRALLTNPSLIVFDECLSNLDVINQVKFIESFIEILKSKNITVIFISHDLGMVQKICDRVLVLNEGEIVESGNSLEIFQNPKTQTTRQLVESSL